MKLKAEARFTNLPFHPSSLILHLISSVRKHRLDSFQVRFCYQSINVEQSFPFVGLLGQNVARMRMAAFDLSSRGQTKAFRCTLVCF